MSIESVPGTNTFLAKKTAQTTRGPVSTLTKPLDFKGDCQAMFRGVPPRVASGTPLCAAAAQSPYRNPPAISTAGKGISVCAPRKTGASTNELTCSASPSAVSANACKSHAYTCCMPLSVPPSKHPANTRPQLLPP